MFCPSSRWYIHRQNLPPSRCRSRHYDKDSVSIHSYLQYKLFHEKWEYESSEMIENTCERLTDVAVNSFPPLSTDALVIVDAINAGAPIEAWILFTVIYVYGRKKTPFIFQGVNMNSYLFKFLKIWRNAGFFWKFKFWYVKTIRDVNFQPVLKMVTQLKWF